ncbi:hypothetical protein [Endozoicomonas sp. GU-1]|uniref:hypothetical protein n=1 Tax=Endozoicomonas sp. GU-1 TaxID=3009078 RepID=UPI0022B56AC9|nr:hypothetical protein [Endozoicomonas sp. GU-1]WBA86325.1 hypothetical protein O3276_24515 [Endozoicomonas sp. GU-1]
MNNQIAPTSATYPNAYTADATQKDLSEQSTKKKFLSYRTSVEPDFQKLINKNQAETKVLEGKIENMQKKLTEYLQYRAHDKLFIKPAPEKNHSNSIETNSIANKPLTPLSENSTTTDVNPQTTGLPSGSTTDSTVSSPILSTADHTSTFTPSIPTHTTVNDSSATATAQSVNTTQATNTTSPLTPTTALPPLGELLSKSVKITLMASLRDELEYYQQNRPIATGENSWGNITEIAQQPETIIGKRPDGPLPHIRDNQRPHPMIALSELISAIEARVTMYELFNLVLIVSSFTRAIKKSFPAVAGRYDNKLKQLADQIKSYLPSHDQDDTKRKRTRRELTEEEIKGIKFKFERLLDEFEEEPMKKEMKKFFQGFRQMRDTFTKAMYEGKNITKEPELKEFEEMFELMKNKETIKSGLEKYSQYIDKAIKDKDFYQAGQITFKVNILYNKIKNILEGYESNNPYHEFLVEFKALDATLDKLQSLANKAAALVDLDKIFYQAIAHDALALAYDKKLGYCFADVLSTAIAGQNGKYSTSLTSLAESILFGTGYTRLPVQIRITLQDVLYLKTPSSLKNHPASLGLNADSLYIAQAYKKAQTVRVAVDNELEITSRGFNSISDLIKKLLHQVDVDSLGTELVQFGVAPASNHIFYLAFSKSDNVFRLTVQDVQVGVITVTGNDLNQLQRNILMVLERFSDHYKIPLAPPHGRCCPHSRYRFLSSYQGYPEPV